LERAIAEKDTPGLSQILRLSRLELQLWHNSTLKQNQRSFRYAILAMWVGFAILTVGLASAFGVAGLESPESGLLDINVVVLASGAIVEFVSGLFLWIYKSSQNQFRYFYDRQMANYDVLMAYRVADTMAERDECKSSVVETLLSSFDRRSQQLAEPSRSPAARPAKSSARRADQVPAGTP
jgi:hypothetical protein